MRRRAHRFKLFLPNGREAWAEVDAKTSLAALMENPRVELGVFALSITPKGFDDPGLCVEYLGEAEIE